MTSRLWLDPTFGVSGDMILGALTSLVDDPDVVDELIDAVRTIGVEGWAIERSEVDRAGLTATRIAVSSRPGTPRRWSEIDAMVARLTLPSPVVDGSRRTFRLLAETEADQHGVPVDDVHFHEVGAVDALVDIVGSWWLLHRLGVDDVVVGPIGIGHGTVDTDHGVLPVPAPATLAILGGAPIRSLDAPFETCTPTGAALVRCMGTWGRVPDGTIVRSGRGAGGRNPSSHPNVLTAVIVADLPAETGDVRPAVVIETNVDDVTPETLARLVDVLLGAGADDAWITPIVMKKGRPAHQVCALAAPESEAAVRLALATESGTLGLRTSAVAKHVASRRIETVQVRGSAIRMKVGPHGAKPEHDDVAAIADRDGVPVRIVAAEALAAWMGAS